jgi:hypothetical protein
VYIAEFTSSKQKAAMWYLNYQLENALTKSSNGSKPLIIIAGDFNGANVATLCNTNQLYKLNGSATRGKNCLDIILTNAPNSYHSELWPPLGKSDHSVVIAIPPKQNYKTSKPATARRLVKTGKIQDTVHLIRNIDWQPIRKMIQTDLQAATDLFYAAIKTAEDLCQPLKSIKSKEDQPWMTFEIKKMIQERQRLFHSNLKEKWLDISNKIKLKIRKRKKEYFQNKYVLGNPNWWKEVNELRLNQNGSEPDEELAKNLNEGFHSVWNTIPQPDISRFIKEISNPENCIFTHRIIINNLEKLNKSATGPDGLSAKLLKSSSLEIADIILELFCNYIKHSFVPTQWKFANITPIPKVEHPKEWEDYRPISVTSSLSKVFERIICKIIIERTKNIWKNNKQHGFLPGKSTMDALIKVIDDWSMAIDRKESMLAIFFDFAKAFDLVDHEILLTKLDSLLPSWLVSWIASYLTKRKQRVRINDIETEWKNVEAGVIQGSVLGPILFILFISDINDYLPSNVEIEKYADDILGYLIGKASSNLPQELIDGIHSWCIANKMKLNTKKCKVVFTPGKDADQPPKLYLSGEELEVVDSYCYLGIDINNKLDWSQQWNRILKKTNSVPFLIKQLKRLGFKKDILTTVYKSLFISHLDYNSPVLISTTLETKAQINRVQARILKIIGIKRTESLEKFKIEDPIERIEKMSLKKVSKLLADPQNALSKKYKNIDRTNSLFSFKTKKARTKIYNDSVVQKCIRTLRDDFDKQELYRLKIPRTIEKGQLETNKAKVKAECPTCNKLFEAKIGIKTHMRKCPNKPN